MSNPKYKAGDIVTIGKAKPIVVGSHHKDKWNGHNLTISKIIKRFNGICYATVEETCGNDSWIWTEEEIEGLANINESGIMLSSILD